MVQQREAGASSPEGLRSRYDSNFERIRRHLQYNLELKSAGRSPLLDTTNEYGVQDGYFFIAPIKPEFSIKILGKIQEKLANELGVAFEPDFAPKEERDEMRFGLIRVKDPLFTMTRQAMVTEIEEGSALGIGIKEGETSKEFSGTIERMTFVRLYPHVDLANIARYVQDDHKFHGNNYHYLSGLLHGISREQMDIFRKLSERRASFHEIKDALIAKELEKQLNNIVQVNRRNITVGPRVSIDF